MTVAVDDLYQQNNFIRIVCAQVINRILLWRILFFTSSSKQWRYRFLQWCWTWFSFRWTLLFTWFFSSWRLGSIPPSVFSKSFRWVWDFYWRIPQQLIFFPELRCPSSEYQTAENSELRLLPSSCRHHWGSLHRVQHRFWTECRTTLISPVFSVTVTTLIRWVSGFFATLWQRTWRCRFRYFRSTSFGVFVVSNVSNVRTVEVDFQRIMWTMFCDKYVKWNHLGCFFFVTYCTFAIQVRIIPSFS